MKSNGVQQGPNAELILENAFTALRILKMSTPSPNDMRASAVVCFCSPRTL